MSLNGPSSPLFFCVWGVRIGGLDAEDPTPHGLAQVGGALSLTVNKLLYSSSSKARVRRVRHVCSVIKGAGAGKPGAETCGSGKTYFGPPFCHSLHFCKILGVSPFDFSRST
ncbi:hypothetical protein CDAR_316211 [Caerostris darwini]|uniref:Uncharacterized protein n=1 Tax=Caerostris darwini TaxID=1538125 RepID=A0AAV4QAX4_9ARAC|nr:hypothetical protein CDAR_316211 [Caerostris darwini]